MILNFINLSSSCAGIHPNGSGDSAMLSPRSGRKPGVALAVFYDHLPVIHVHFTEFSTWIIDLWNLQLMFWVYFPISWKNSSSIIIFRIVERVGFQPIAGALAVADIHRSQESLRAQHVQSNDQSTGGSQMGWEGIPDKLFKVSGCSNSSWTSLPFSKWHKELHSQHRCCCCCCCCCCCWFKFLISS